MVRRLLIGTLALGAFSAGASTAEARHRTAHDPCHGEGASVQHDAQGHVTRVCSPRFLVPPHLSAYDPAAAHGTACPDGYRIPGSKHGLPGEMAWEYWTYNGEWVTWNWPLAHDRPAHTGDGGAAEGLSGLYPSYHNWSPWAWSVRTSVRCEPLPSA